MYSNQNKFFMKMNEKKILKLILPVFILVLVLQFTGCGLKTRATEDLDKFAVFGDKEVLDRCRVYVDEYLGRVIDTPQPEPVFILEYPDWSAFGENYNRANILLVGTLEGTGPVSEFVHKMLDEDTRTGVKNGVYWIFSKENPWFYDQRLIIVCANDPEELATRLNFEGDDLFRTANNSALERLEKQMFSRNENKEMEDSLANEYGLYLRIQHDYYIVHEDLDERLIRLRRTFREDRFLSISWSEQSVDFLTEEMVVAERIRIGKLFADPISIISEFNRFEYPEEVYPGTITLRGLWGLDSNMGGGPFFTYALRDSITGIVYYIDGAVFAPDKEKMPFLRQLEVIARTFKPPSEFEKRES